MFSRKRLTKGDKGKNVAFENSGSYEERLRIERDGNIVASGLWESNKDNICQEEMERIVTPYDRFEWLLDDEEGQPEVFVPVDMHHYDEEDYRDHRHRAYPHVHQPLRSMEPRVLMKIKTRIKASKRAEDILANAGVPLSVPGLLTSDTDTHVRIEACHDISGPILSVVLPLRRKRKRKRKRSKKHEPFQPTLCKLSEESSSPLHSVFTDEYEDVSIGGLVLEELSEAMRSMKDGIPTSSSIQAPQISSASTLSFLDEIASVDLPIGFLDMTHQCYTARQHSLPFFENMDRVDMADNINTSQSFVDLKKPSKHLKFVLPGDHCDPDQPSLGQTDTVDYLRCSSSNPVVISPITHSQGDLNEVSLTQVASTSAITSDSSIKISNCNFQVGSVDSVTVSQQNIFNVDQLASFDRSVSQPVQMIDTKTDKSSASSHHHYHHHHKEHYNKRDLEKRTFSGQDMRSLWQSKDTEEVDEYESTLGDAIIDDMRNHRCYEMPALNRTRIRNRYIHSNSNRRALHRSRSVSHSRTDDKYQRSHEALKKCTTCGDDAYKSHEYTKSQQDLIFQSNGCPIEWKHCNDGMEENPMPLFVQMDILKPHKYWREISRWIRYEQRYNELSDTFGRAHSSPLKFTAFTQFRVQLEDAIFMPYVEAKTFEEAINQLTEELLVAQLFAEPRDSFFVKDVFKWRHIHAGEKFTLDGDDGNQLPCESTNNLYPSDHKDCSMRLINTSPGNINNATSGYSFCAGPTKIAFDHAISKATEPSLSNKFGAHTNCSSMIKMLRNSIPILRHAKHPKSDLEGHLPLNTEGVTVQVGALDSLKKPFFAILRFKQPIFMDRVTELNLPIRFLIVCLGPPAKIQYEELGRVISSMLINKDFSKLMYRATDKCEIIEGLYKYLDTCFVLSYAGPHPTKNIHSMADHIHDFVRVETNPSPFHSASKETESIKHSASIDRTYEQRSQIVRLGDSVRFDRDHGGDSQRSRVIYEQFEPDLESGKDLSVDSKSINFKSKQTCSESLVIKVSSRNQSPVQVRMCCNITFFLFRLLRLDAIKYKNRFLSDFRDAFLKENIVIVLCGLMYLYFVCLSPALTFGVLLGDLVSKEFNVQMVLICTGLLTMVFALIGGNPLLVIGITGPMFLMETVIAKMASSFKLQIMLYRFVIAVYVSFIGLVSVAFNITWVMQKVRRSVEECFNGFVGLYFIFKAGLTIIRIFAVTNSKSMTMIKFNNTIDVPAKTENQIAIGFASLVFAYSMYQICMALNSVNRGRFFTRKFRKMMDYFNVAIGILVLSLINVVIFNILGINLPTLKADTVNSAWFRVPPDALKWQSLSFAAHAVAFLLAFALMSLIFTETAISGITVTKIEKKLVKSSLFAQDQFMCLCIIPVICGLLGWPFLSGAAVRSTSHVIAMTKWDQKVIPGVKHKILGVVEQRVTMIIVGALVLATVSIESVLGYVPTAAMLGMFLYMGVMGIRDLVVTRRLIAMFKRRKHWKDHEYLRDIPPSVLKSFEILQLAMIAIMFSMNCITEFAGISWSSFLIPVILLAYALCRETVLPRSHWFAPHLDKLDPRHYVQMAPLCSTQNRDLFSGPDKQPLFLNRPSSVSSAILLSSGVVNTTDTRFDFDDGTNTSGDDISDSSSDSGGAGGS